MGLPASVLPLIRSAFTSQGFPASAITDAGDLDAAVLLSSAYDTIEFRSSLTPPVQVRTAELGKGSPPSAFTKWLQPTVVLSGGVGRVAIAPHGEAGDGTFTALALVIGVFGVGFLLGRLTA